jgi:hypothetical protein
MTPEMRRRVADEVRQMPHIIAMSGEIMIVAHDRHGNRTFVDSWDPVESLEQKDALTRRCAELIEKRKKAYFDTLAMPNPSSAKLNNEWRHYLEKFCTALATNNVDAIEELLGQLIEVRDE